MGITLSKKRRFWVARVRRVHREPVSLQIERARWQAAAEAIEQLQRALGTAEIEVQALHMAAVRLTTYLERPEDLSWEERETIGAMYTRYMAFFGPLVLPGQSEEEVDEDTGEDRV